MSSLSHLCTFFFFAFSLLFLWPGRDRCVELRSVRRRQVQHHRGVGLQRMRRWDLLRRRRRRLRQLRLGEGRLARSTQERYAHARTHARSYLFVSLGRASRSRLECR